jgi:hypothetical protein
MANILLTIYAKSEQVDIAADDVQSIITDYDRQIIINQEDVSDNS